MFKFIFSNFRNLIVVNKVIANYISLGKSTVMNSLIFFSDSGITVMINNAFLDTFDTKFKKISLLCI